MISEIRCGTMRAAPPVASDDAACPIRSTGRNDVSVSPNDPPGEDSPAPVEDRLRAAYDALRILGREIRTMRGDD